MTDRDLDPLSDRDLWCDDADAVSAWEELVGGIALHPRMYIRGGIDELGAMLCGFAIGREELRHGVWDGFRRWMGRRNPSNRNCIADALVQWEVEARHPDASDIEAIAEYTTLLCRYLDECKDPTLQGAPPPLLVGGVMSRDIRDRDPWLGPVDDLRQATIRDFPDDTEPVSLYIAFDLPWDEDDDSPRGPAFATIDKVWNDEVIEVSCPIPPTPPENPRGAMFEYIDAAADLAEAWVRERGIATNLPLLRQTIDRLRAPND